MRSALSAAEEARTEAEAKVARAAGCLKAADELRELRHAALPVQRDWPLTDAALTALTVAQSSRCNACQRWQHAGTDSIQGAELARAAAAAPRLPARCAAACTRVLCQGPHSSRQELAQLQAQAKPGADGGSRDIGKAHSARGMTRRFHRRRLGLQEACEERTRLILVLAHQQELVQLQAQIKPGPRQEQGCSQRQPSEQSMPTAVDGACGHLLGT